MRKSRFDFSWKKSWQDVKQVLAQSKLPNGISFRILTIAGVVFELYYLEDMDIWLAKQN